MEGDRVAERQGVIVHTMQPLLSRVQVAADAEQNEDETPQPRGDAERERRERDGESGGVGD